MSQGKQSKFIVIYFSVLGAGALALGYLAWSASSDSDEAEHNYQLAAADLDRLENYPLSRTKENAEEKRKKVEAYVGEVKALNTTLMGYQAPLNAAESNESFQKKLSEVTKTVKDNAVAKGVKLDPKFDLGMGNYLSEFPLSGTAPRLSAELDGIVFLADAAMDAGVNSIDALTREPLPFEKERAETGSAAPLTEAQKQAKAKADAAKAKAAAAAAAAAPKAKGPVGPTLDESKVLERQPMTITVTGKNRSILNLLQTLANASPDKAPHFFTIRTLRVENESNDGPPKSVTVEKREVPVDPDNKDSKEVYTQDAVFLLGNEKVKMHLDLDLVRFVEPPVEAEKAAPGKPVDKKPAAAKPNTPAAPSGTAPAPTATPAPAPAPSAQ